jgi:hypothetical protein
MHEIMLPCPRYLELDQANPGAFRRKIQRNDCTLHFVDTNDTDNKDCGTCNDMVEVGKILKNDLRESLLPCPQYRRRRAGTGYELVSEMQEGVRRCKV